MALIERTVYPRFKRFLSSRELHVFYTPHPDEIAWARDVAGSDGHLLAVMVQLKAFCRLGHFPELDEVPAVVTDHIRRDLRLPQAVRAEYASVRTAERHRSLIRQRSGMVCDPQRARGVAAEAMEEAATRRNDLTELINLAVERLTKRSFELPAFRTLDDMAATILGTVNEGILTTVAQRLGPLDVTRLTLLLEAAGPDGGSEFTRLRQAVRRAPLADGRPRREQLRWVAGIGDARAWWAGVAHPKIADFAAEALSSDAVGLRDRVEPERSALLAALVFTAQAKARDEVTEMFGRRLSMLVRRSRTELEELERTHRAITERPLANYRSVREHIDRTSVDVAERPAELAMPRGTVGAAGQHTGIDAISAKHRDNRAHVVPPRCRVDRAAEIPDVVGALDMGVNTANRVLVESSDFVHGHVLSPRDDACLGAFFLLRHLEACGLRCLSEESPTGDTPVDEVHVYLNWAGLLVGGGKCAEWPPTLSVGAEPQTELMEIPPAPRAQLTARRVEPDTVHPDHADPVTNDVTEPTHTPGGPGGVARHVISDPHAVQGLAGQACGSTPTAVHVHSHPHGPLVHVLARLLDLTHRVHSGRDPHPCRLPGITACDLGNEPGPQLPEGDLAERHDGRLLRTVDDAGVRAPARGRVFVSGRVTVVRDAPSIPVRELVDSLERWIIAGWRTPMPMTWQAANDCRIRIDELVHGGAEPGQHHRRAKARIGGHLGGDRTTAPALTRGMANAQFVEFTWHTARTVLARRGGDEHQQAAIARVVDELLHGPGTRSRQV